MPINTQHIELLKNRLKEPLPGRPAQERMTGRVVTMPPTVPENAKPSAVLCLLFPMNDELHLLLMKRREDSTAHSGQVSFPGGRVELTDENYMFTALREANEEVGIQQHEVEVLGALTPLYIPVSNFNVFPYIAFTPQRPLYNLSQNEVSYTIEVPLASLLAPERKTITDVRSPASPQIIRNVNAYVLTDGTVIWGATAMIISELEVIVSNLVK